MPTTKTPTVNAGCNKPASQPTQDHGIFIYDMPVTIQQLLFTVLDRSREWEQLADHMGYKEPDKQVGGRVICCGFMGYTKAKSSVEMCGDYYFAVCSLKEHIGKTD